MTTFQHAAYSNTVLTDGSWFQQWLANYFGAEAASSIQIALTIIINLIIAYVIVMQFFRILKGIESKNSADAGERASAMATIKNAILVIVLITVIGVGGFNALLWLGGNFINN